LEATRHIGVVAGLLRERLTARSANPDDERLLRGLELEAIRMGGQVRALGRFARHGSAVVEPAPQPLLALIEGAVARTTAVADGIVSIEVPPGLGIRCDPGQLTTALVELLRNAGAAAVDGRPLAIRITARAGVDGCRIQIVDSGRGLSAGHRALAFRLLTASGDTAGTGIGLALVRAIVDAHGGQVRIEGTPGVGTMVELYVPA
jgi:two-component system OmpR family sensor kinase